MLQICFAPVTLSCPALLFFRASVQRVDWIRHLSATWSALARTSVVHVAPTWCKCQDGLGGFGCHVVDWLRPQGITLVGPGYWYLVESTAFPRALTDIARTFFGAGQRRACSTRTNPLSGGHHIRTGAHVWMSTRKLPGGKKRPAHRADNLAAIYEPNVWNVGASTSRNLKGLHGLYGDNFTFT
jgi:hypothetical protein